MKMEKFCQKVGFGVDIIKSLLRGESVGFHGEIYSHEYKRYFKTAKSVAKIEQDPAHAGKYCLCIDGKEVSEWFRYKQQELLQKHVGVDISEKKQHRGIRR